MVCWGLGVFFGGLVCVLRVFFVTKTRSYAGQRSYEKSLH